MQNKKAFRLLNTWAKPYLYADEHNWNRHIFSKSKCQKHQKRSVNAWDWMMTSQRQWKAWKPKMPAPCYNELINRKGDL